MIEEIIQTELHHYKMFFQNSFLAAVFPVCCFFIREFLKFQNFLFSYWAVTGGNTTVRKSDSMKLK